MKSISSEVCEPVVSAERASSLGRFARDEAVETFEGREDIVSVREGL